MQAKEQSLLAVLLNVGKRTENIIMKLLCSFTVFYFIHLGWCVMTLIKYDQLYTSNGELGLLIGGTVFFPLGIVHGGILLFNFLTTYIAIIIFAAAMWLIIDQTAKIRLTRLLPPQ